VINGYAFALLGVVFLSFRTDTFIACLCADTCCSAAWTLRAMIKKVTTFLFCIVTFSLATLTSVTNLSTNTFSTSTGAVCTMVNFNASFLFWIVFRTFFTDTFMATRCVLALS